MTAKEYLKEALSSEINISYIEKVEKKYNAKLSLQAKAFISCSNSTIFFDEDKRLLEFSEILNAEEYLHVNFKIRGIVPIIDCNDNDFIVYDYKNDSWGKFNIIDKILFKKNNKVEDIL